jgi:acetyl-CoA synthetase
MLTVWGQDERFIDTYYAKYSDQNSKDWRDWPFMCGDGAVQADDGYFRILGRIDDVINVAGHRLGTKELESAAIEVEEIAEAAAVPVVDETRGKIVEMYVSLKPEYEPSEELAKKVSQQIVKDIGAIARPKNVWIVPDMPKTRSGKIMRRVIAGISNFQDVGDVSTLANPEVVEEIQEKVQAAKREKGEVPQDLSSKEKEEIASYGTSSE